MKYICIIFFLLITLQPLSAQEDDIVSVVFAAFDQSDYNAANAVIKNLKTSELKKVLETHYELIKNGTWNTDTFKSKDTLSRAYNIHLLNLGIATYIKKGDDISSFEILKESSLLAKQRNDAVLLCQSFKFMLEIYLRYHVVIGDDNYLTIIEDFRKHAYSDEQSEIIDYFEFHKFVRDNYQNPANTTLDSLYKRYIQKTGSNPFYNVRKSEVLNSYHRKIS